MKHLILIVVAFVCIGITTNAQETGTFKDTRDGKVYKTVKIGTQTWFAENLAYKPSSGNYWAYDNDQSNVSKYGYLYDFETAKKVCPSGWHLPKESEFVSLILSYGDKDKGYIALIETGNSGFNSKFGGMRHDQGTYHYLGESAYYWYNLSGGYNLAWQIAFIGSYKTIAQDDDSKNLGLSVRCIKD